MDFLKDCGERVVLILFVVGTFIWMQNRIEKRFNKIEKDITIIKTVLIIRDIMPKELAHAKPEEKVREG